MRLSTIVGKLKAISTSAIGDYSETATVNLRRAFPDMQTIGSGIDRIAYRIGDYVVKRDAAFRPKRLSNSQKRVMRQLDVKPIRTRYVNGWTVQPLAITSDKFSMASPDYQRISSTVTQYQDMRNKSRPIDFHTGNLGVNQRDGKLVMFDW